MAQDLIERLRKNGLLNELDDHFSRLMVRLSDDQSSELRLAAALVSHATRQGHICLDLAKLGGTALLGADDGKAPVVCPDAQAWLYAIKKTSVVGAPGERKPLITDDRGRLYLYRYWEYQDILARQIVERVGSGDEAPADSDRLRPGLDRLFGTAVDHVAAGGSKAVNWQKVAAVVALLKRFCIISGGPGTGKTTTVAKILALMLEQSQNASLRIALAAPTGKAAARLQEAIKATKQTLPCEESITNKIPEEATTIHRLLGTVSGSPYFRHHTGNPLPADVVVVDEASMVDLALMSKLVQALDSNARLVLLGDKDQLASVEAGAVLGDLCDAGPPQDFSREFSQKVRQLTTQDIPPSGSDRVVWPLADCVVELQENFRFSKSSGIYALSRAVNAGQADQALGLLENRRHDDLVWNDLSALSTLRSAIRQTLLPVYSEYLRAETAGAYFLRFNGFRVLCALREGPYGVVAFNALIEDELARHGLISHDGPWYRGRPVLITSNAYDIGLYNGDVGITWPDPESGELRVFFPTPEGLLRKLHPIRLPDHETVFAMTVHKSQGSEFDDVLLVMPDKASPLLTRELIYTGITRARRRVEIWTRLNILHTAVSQRIQRSSGLRDALLEALSRRSPG
ncbi:MAG: exodeoxyribonuclease V subunit alpha [Deltaproteobacteria bacterium]|nr:exodeoxyribonuclease V subunit alpha [Deltaproteobacteria bacterium]